MNRCFLIFYEWFLIPLVQSMLLALRFVHPKIRAGLNLRKTDQWPTNKTIPCFWIHVSSGEWEYARPVARELRRRGFKILVTHFSPSVRASIETSKEADFVFASPMDHRWAFKKLFRNFQPSHLLIARTDLWPVMLQESKKYGVRTVLFSATLSDEKLAQMGYWARLITVLKYKMVDEIFAVTEQDARNISQLSGRMAQVMGDTRYDQVFYRLDQTKNIKPIKPNEDFFVCGSTWSSDESVLLPAIAKLSHLPFVVVPHEPTLDHIERLKSNCEKLGLEGVLYSQVHDNRWWKPGRVLLVDQVGLLAELYKGAKFAFVGNSFERHAVHSVMEPLACGCLTFVGPFYKNNREAIEFSSVQVGKQMAVQVIENSDQLVEKVRASHKDLALAAQIVDEVRRRTGSSQKLCEMLLKE